MHAACRLAAKEKARARGASGRLKKRWGSQAAAARMSSAAVERACTSGAKPATDQLPAPALACSRGSVVHPANCRPQIMGAMDAVTPQ